MMSSILTLWKRSHSIGKCILLMNFLIGRIISSYDYD
jgi:hypothetical protein